jgi:hypothetical protein
MDKLETLRSSSATGSEAQAKPRDEQNHQPQVQAGEPNCAVNHHKYVGKCPHCHTPLPGVPQAGEVDLEEVLSAWTVADASVVLDHKTGGRITLWKGQPLTHLAGTHKALSALSRSNTEAGR